MSACVVSCYMLCFIANLYVVLWTLNWFVWKIVWFNSCYIKKEFWFFFSFMWFVFHSRHEHQTYVPSPAQLIRRQFQKAKPNLGRAHSKKEESGIEKNRADPSESQKPEDNLLQQGDSDTQLLQKVSLKNIMFISGLIVRESLKNIYSLPFVF